MSPSELDVDDRESKHVDEYFERDYLKGWARALEQQKDGIRTHEPRRLEDILEDDENGEDEDEQVQSIYTEP